jgi:hypothetical protein
MALTPTDPTKPQVWINGQAPNQTLDFYIPQGPKGDPGGFASPTNIPAGADLNAYMTAGLYRKLAPAEATMILNFPKDALAGSLRVYERAAGYGWQEYEGLTSGQEARVLYRRAFVNSVFMSWRAVVTQRVDQTAGRAIYTWDDINSREQRIYGDTGWRDVGSSLINGATATSFLLRRQNDNVYLRITGLQLPTSAVGDSFYTLPAGFISASFSYGLLRESVNTGNAAGFGIATSCQLYGNIPGWTPNNTTHRFAGTLMAVTDNVWPTTLPGVASGTVINS